MDLSRIKRYVDALRRMAWGYILSDYDTKWQKQVTDAAKSELYLLGTLGTNKVTRWLPGSQKKGAFHMLGLYAVCGRSGTETRPSVAGHPQKSARELRQIRRILDSYSKEAAELQTGREVLAQSETRLSKCAEALACSAIQLTMIPKQWSMGLVYGALTGELFASQTDMPLLEVYCAQNGLQPEQGVSCLCRDLGIDWTGLADLPKIEKRMGLRSLAVGHSTLPQLLVPMYGASACQLVKTIDFQDEVGRVLLRVQRYDMPDGRFGLFPVTCWHREGDCFRRYLFTPPETPSPLLNLKQIVNAMVEVVLMSDSLELAYDLQLLLNQPVGDPRILPEVQTAATSWYGGAEAIHKVNCSALKGKRVLYLVLEHSGNSREQALANAAKVYGHLSSLGVDVEVVDCWTKAYRKPAVDDCDEPFTFPARPVLSIIDPAELMAASRAAGAKTGKDAGRSAQGEGSVTMLGDCLRVMDETFLFSPVIGESSSTLLFAPAGLGKTWTGLYLACALASGEPAFGHWLPERPRGVLYLDGEMGKKRMSRRVTTMAKLFREESQALIRTHMMWSSVNNECLDLSTEEDQAIIERKIADARVRTGEGIGLLVLDNLQALLANCQTPAAWKALNVWLAELNARGIATLVLHHPNKKGDMLGSVAIRNSLDNVLLLTPEADENSDGIAYCLTWDKARDLKPGDRKPIHVELNPDSEHPTIKFWTDDDDCQEALHAVIRGLVAAGDMTDEQVSSAVGMKLNTYKALKRQLGLTGRGAGKGRKGGGRGKREADHGDDA